MFAADLFTVNIPTPAPKAECAARATSLKTTTTIKG